MKLIYRKGTDFRYFVAFLILLALMCWLFCGIKQEVKYKRPITKTITITKRITVKDSEHVRAKVNGYKK